MQSGVGSHELGFVLIVIINTQEVKLSKYEIHGVLPCACAGTMPDRDRFHISSPCRNRSEYLVHLTPFPPINPSVNTEQVLLEHLATNLGQWVTYLQELHGYLEPLELAHSQQTVLLTRLELSQERVEELKLELSQEREAKTKLMNTTQVPVSSTVTSLPIADAPTLTPVTRQSPPTPIASTRVSERIPDPAPFSGSRKDYRRFEREITDKMKANLD